MDGKKPFGTGADDKNLTLFNDIDAKKKKAANAKGSKDIKLSKNKKTTTDSLIEKPQSRIAILISNGSIRHYSQVWKNVKNITGSSTEAPFIAAADGGSMHCINFRVVPDLIIGDMDSIAKSMIEKLNAVAPGKDIEFITCSPSKDESDTQLALDHLARSGFKKVIILGAFGSRADHSFANIVLLANPAYDGLKISIVTDNSEIFVEKSPFAIEGMPGKKLSLFSLSPYVYFKKTTGLLYSLKKEKLVFSPVRGLSNEFTENTAKIDFSEGELLVIREL